MTDIIIHAVGGLYRVRRATGEVIACKARGVFRHEKLTPLVGDRVTLEQEADGMWITAIGERKNALIRPAMANLDVLFVVCAARDPDPSLRFLDKLLCIAEYEGIEPILVVTKGDLDAHRASQLRTKYEKAGFRVFVTDAESGAEDGMLSDCIASFSEDTTAAFCGASGVGKSTLMNRLFPHLSLETGEISEKIARGKHTTRAVTLFPIAEIAENGAKKGYLADTPGFSMLDFERFDFFSLEDLPYTFREFVPYIGKCRYTKCTHTKEDGCAIIAAAESKDIPKSRHKSYTELYEALKDKHAWDGK